MTTTTHMAWENGRPWVELGLQMEGNHISPVSKERMSCLLEQQGYAFVGHRMESGEKISNPFPEDERGEWVEELLELADVVLTEADGARRQPLKVPAAWEPVIPSCTSLVLGVMGLNCLGELPEHSCYGRERWKFQGEKITGEDLAALAISEQGLKKQVVPGMKYFVLLNQADQEDTRREGLRICRILKRNGVDCAVSRLRDRLGVILLASGASSRFGGNKLLYALDGQTMAEKALQLICSLPVQKRVTVTRYEAVRKAAQQRGCQVVWNDHVEKGISRSICLGLKCCGDMDGWMFLVCDQPWLKEESVGRLIRRWQESPRGIAALCHGDRTGNPVIFSQKYREELLQLNGDRGGKCVLRRHFQDVELVETASAELEDVDEKMDLSGRKD